MTRIVLVSVATVPKLSALTCRHHEEYLLERSLFRRLTRATVCYISTVGVRELRQNASELLARVAATGESILITNHGRLVARLVPAEAPARASRDQLLAAGTLRAGRGDPLGVAAVTAPVGTPSTSELLSADREDR